jgi:hypothetical protein
LKAAKQEFINDFEDNLQHSGMANLFAELETALGRAKTAIDQLYALQVTQFSSCSDITIKPISSLGEKCGITCYNSGNGDTVTEASGCCCYNSGLDSIGNSIAPYEITTDLVLEEEGRFLSEKSARGSAGTKNFFDRYAAYLKNGCEDILRVGEIKHTRRATESQIVKRESRRAQSQMSWNNFEDICDVPHPTTNTDSCGNQGLTFSDMSARCDDVCGPNAWPLMCGSPGTGLPSDFFRSQCSEELVDPICEEDFYTPLLLAVQTALAEGGDGDESLVDLIKEERRKLGDLQNEVAKRLRTRVEKLTEFADSNYNGFVLQVATAKQEALDAFQANVRNSDVSRLYTRLENALGKAKRSIDSLYKSLSGQFTKCTGVAVKPVSANDDKCAMTCFNRAYEFPDIDDASGCCCYIMGLESIGGSKIAALPPVRSRKLYSSQTLSFFDRYGRYQTAQCTEILKGEDLGGEDSGSKLGLTITGIAVGVGACCCFCICLKKKKRKDGADVGAYKKDASSLSSIVPTNRSC